MQKNYLLTFLLSVLSTFIFAQSGEISGKVTDENGEGIPFANVAIVENGIPIGMGATTDFDGFYSIKPLNPGRYDVKFSYLGYTSIIKSQVVVKNDQTTYIDQPLSPSEQIIEEVQIIEYKIPLIDPGETSSKNTITAEDIADLPTRNIQNLASTTAGVSQGDKDGGINVRGGRGDAIVYYVDGIRVSGNVNLPISAVEQIDIITGGVSAKFGDATSGVINISTKGGARKFMGGIEVQHSLDRWRFDLVNANFAGPMVKNKEGATVIGYSINTEFQRQLDPRPSSVDMYKVRDDVFEDIQQNPLFMDDNGLVQLRSENLTNDDLEVNRIRRNTTDLQARFNGRLDFRLNDKMNLALGGNLSYNRYNLWIEDYSLLNFENNPLYNDLNYKAFARFTHNVSKGADPESQRSKLFQNVYYQVQFDYEKFKRTYEDANHGDDLFAYGYIGDFDVRRAPVFGQNEDGTFRELIGYSDTATYFTPGTVNGNASNFTSQLYDLVGQQDVNGDLYFDGGILDLQANRAGLINGERATLPHSIWFNTGRQYNGFAVDNDDDKFRLQLNGGFDILKPGSETRNKHSITFGLEVEQRISRHYSLNPLGLWDLSRQLTNTHLSFDRDNPFFYNGGNPIAVDPNNPDIYLGDTVFYQYAPNPDERQNSFDRNLRDKIGAADNEWINIYGLPLETFSIDMFSADELLNNFNVNDYRGYDVYGNRVAGNISFQDFWNKTDENGNKTRPIAPFRPIYAAGYIEDKFQLKDLTFRIGLRVDRWDANQYVMRDPYSVAGSVTAGEINIQNRPENIRDNFVVYAESANAPVQGYRDGDRFFNSEGVEVVNYNSLSGAPTPLRPDGQAANPQDEGFDPDVAFEKYQATYVVMPRLQFSFNITDNALFFAHYDVLSQSPQSRLAQGFSINRSIGSPLDYYFFSEMSQRSGGFINNPNLAPEITIDFQLGFKQKLTNSSAVTFSAYFKEFKNQIQVRRYDGIDLINNYFSYDNIDFGNTKGFEFGYDLRRTNNIRITANYTLQFAEGTGSDDVTQRQVITQTGGTNFRTVAPLNFDFRHALNATFDYRFSEGKNYNGPVTKNGKQILANTGLNLLAQANSGRPYTRIREPIAERVIGAATRSITDGGLNASRLGWIFRVDLRLNKSFTIETNKKREDKESKKLYVDAYLWIDNVLGTANVLNVYRYTGSPSEDGYLASPQGQTQSGNSLNPESYRDLYRASVNTPTHYSLPRRIYLGASINF